MKMNQKAEFTNKVIIQERPHTCVLTISLLVSNHIDTISKCMESIQPLLEQISSELIVVDTVGADQSDGSLAVAEKYADKIVHFDWCDDFSAARNAGLKCAHGEWFLFLDDDEWFDDVLELVNFFKDENVRKNYYSLYYTQRNYLSSDGKKYEDVSVYRGSRILINSAFQYRVHETLKPLYHPSVTINAFVHHYGYLNEKKDGAKAYRNEPLLLREIEENPYNFHAWDQFVAGRGKDMVLQGNAAEKALQNWLQCSTAKTKHEYVCHGARYLEFLVNSYIKRSAWEGAQAVYQQYIGQVCQNQYDHCVLGIAMADVYNYLDKEQARIRALKEYLVNYSWLQEHEQEYIEQFSVFFQLMVSEENEWSCLDTLLSLQQKAQDWAGITQDFKTIKWKKNADFIDQYLPKAVNAAYHAGDIITLTEICENLKDSEGRLPLTFGISGNLLKDAEDANRVTAFLSEMKCDDPYILLQRALKAENTNVFSKMLKQLRQQKVTCEVPCQELLPLLLRHAVDPTPFVETLNYEKWMAVVNSVSVQLNSNPENISALINQIEAVFPNSSKKQILLIAVQHNYICNQDVSLTGIMKQLPQYANTIVQYGQSYYAPTLFEDKPSVMLPAEIRFGFYLRKALQEKSKGAAENYLANLRAALKAHPAMELLIKRLLEAFNRETEEANSANLRLRQMAAAVKVQIKKLIQSGMVEQAVPLIQQLGQLLPNDQEIIELQAMCRKK